MEVVQSVITPQEQASLWKQGRTPTDAELKQLALANAGAPFLAECMRLAMAMETNRVTDALPGCSWHQWGEAVTCVWVDQNNRLKWSHKHVEGGGLNGFVVMAEEAAKLGITCGNSFDDSDRGWTHLQLRTQQSPTDVYTIGQIDQEMRKRYSR